MKNFISSWSEFEEEVLHKNRFFCNHEILDKIKKISEQQYEILSPDTVLYRARIISDKEIHEDANRILGDKIKTDDPLKRVKLYDNLGIHGFDDEHSGIPPAEKAENGRLNPAYLPYFYLAKHPYTAVAECKPHQFDNLSVAKYRTTKPIKLMCINRFTNKLDDEINFNEELMNHLNYEFGHPVKNPATGYIITQFIAEFIKNLNFDGICYSSSLHIKGENITLFNKCGCEFEGSNVYKIKDIIFKTKPEIINYQAKDITPSEYQI